MINISNNSNISNKRSDRTFARTCFLTIDVESSFAQTKVGATEDKENFEGVEKLGRILDVFKKHKANATLFVTGEVLARYSGLIKKWAKDFEIACHNYQHITLDKLEIVERERQVKDFIKLYQKIFDKKPKGFRAPRNIIDNKQFPILEAYGFLYDSSVFPRYPLRFQRYEGYRGRAPVKPYWLSKKNYRRSVSRSSGAGGASSKLLEIPESPAGFSIPLVGTWVRKLGVGFYKRLFFFRKPKFINFNMHSWDGIKFFGESSKNSGEVYLRQLDEMLEFLKKAGYQFKSGEQIYKEISNSPNF